MRPVRTRDLSLQPVTRTSTSNSSPRESSESVHRQLLDNFRVVKPHKKVQCALYLGMGIICRLVVLSASADTNDPNWVPHMVDTITFATVDEHPLFRQGLIQTLQRAEGLVCIGEGETAADARRIAALQKPDILILGVFICGGGIEAAQAILSERRQTKVLILTASDDEVYLTKALKAGVRAYVLKGIAGSELVRIIRAVHAREPYIDPALSAQLLLTTSLETPWPVSRHTELSHREQQVLAGVCKGLTDQEIADTLHIKPSTIRYYLTHIFKKLKVHNRVQALNVARFFKTKA